MIMMKMNLLMMATVLALTGSALAAATAPDNNKAADNPLYGFWKGQEGGTVLFKRSELISGGAPVAGVKPAVTSYALYSLSEFTAKQVVVKVTTISEIVVSRTTLSSSSVDFVTISPETDASETLTIPAKLMPDDPAFPKATGAEDLKIFGRTYACTKYTYSTNSKAEMGRDGQGRGQATVWVADGVPGGIVQRRISLTIRASYDITDTLIGLSTGNVAMPTATPAIKTKTNELAVSEADAGKTLKLGANTVAAISLAGNATTGYSWSIIKIDGAALESAGDIQYIPDRTRPGMVGSGGTSIARFRAVKAGSSIITLGYARPWEKGTPSIKTFTVTLVVEKAP
jgi:inhibitor of cysteine peptidase